MAATEWRTPAAAAPQMANTDVKLSSVAKFAVYGILCVLLSDISNDTPTAFLLGRIVLAGLLYATLLLPARDAATLLLVIALAGQDIVSVGPADPEHMTSAIWQLSLGPLNPSAVFFGCLIYQLARIRLYRAGWPIDGALLWFLSVPMVSGLLYGGVFLEFGVSEYVTDIRFPLMLVGSVVLYGSVLRSHPGWAAELVAALFGVLFARHFMDVIYLATNYGAQGLAGVSRSSEDSAKGAVNLLILVGLVAMVVRGRKRLVGIAMVVVFGALSIAYATRLIWVCLVLGGLVLLSILRGPRGLAVLVLSPVLIGSAATLLTVLNPGSALVAAVRAGTVTQGRSAETFAVDVEYNVLSRIDPIRYAEAVNVLDSLGRRGAYLWGTGYGGYYEDDAVDFVERRMGTSFPPFMYQSGRFFNTHEFLTHVFLKHGAIGIALIASVWILPGAALVRALRRERALNRGSPATMVIMTAALTAYLPTSMLHNYWSGKGLFLSGIIIALCIHLARERGALVGSQRGARALVTPSG